MKHLLLISWLLTLTSLGFGQTSKKFYKSNAKIKTTENKYLKYSPITMQLMRGTQGLKKKSTYIDKKFADKHLLRKRSEKFYAGAIVQVNPNLLNHSALDALDVKIRSDEGTIWTMDIPVNAFEAFAGVEGIEYVEVDFPNAKPKLEASRAATNVDDVHSGLGQLLKEYKGKDVVIGIIDFGLVVNHPMFYNESGTGTRIARVWHQNDDSGNSPTSYDYGSEYTGESFISSGRYATSDGSHGTHVAGIAGGSGFGSEGRFRGYAPEAEIVFIELGGGQSAELDGIQYIFDYAESVGKPAVVNMSLGSHIGPHDGTSLLEMGFDERTENGAKPGRILVSAAGNEGATPLHVEYTFSGDEFMATGIKFNQNDDGTLTSQINIWGANASDILIYVDSYDINGNFLEERSIGPISTKSNQFQELNSSNEDIYISVESNSTNPNNGRANAIVEVTVTDEFSKNNINVLFIGSSAGNTVHTWNNGTGNGAILTDEPKSVIDIGSDVWVNGNTDYTVGEFGTSKSTITVGSFNTANPNDNWAQTIGEITNFSSLGPTLDGRVKPDITAPGFRIASGYNIQDSFDENDVAQTVTFQGKEYIYAYSQGTSMAAPAVAGTIALMLEANSNLTHNDILDIFEKTAAEDSFTGSLVSKSNTWGYGKLDAIAAVKMAEDMKPKPAPANLTFNDTTSSITPNTVEVGGEVTFNLTIKNIGEVSSTEKNLAFFYDTSLDGSFLDRINEGENDRTIPSIPAGGSLDTTFIITVPENFVTGDYFFEAYIFEDDAELVQDNAFAEAVTVIEVQPAPANLTFDGVTSSITPSTVEVGGEVTFNLTVRNEGGTSSTATRLGFYYDISQNGNFENSIITQTHDIPSISPSSSFTRSFAITIPSNFPIGNYYFEALLFESEGESSITDNFFMQAVNVTAVTSLITAEFGKTVEVFPNPSTSKFKVNLGDLNAHDIKLSVFSSLGKKIKASTYIQNTKEIIIDLKEAATGMYLLLIDNGEYKINKRIVLR